MCVVPYQFRPNKWVVFYNWKQASAAFVRGVLEEKNDRPEDLCRDPELVARMPESLRDERVWGFIITGNVRHIGVNVLFDAVTEICNIYHITSPVVDPRPDVEARRQILRTHAIMLIQNAPYTCHRVVLPKKIRGFAYANPL